MTLTVRWNPSLDSSCWSAVSGRSSARRHRTWSVTHGARGRWSIGGHRARRSCCSGAILLVAVDPVGDARLYLTLGRPDVVLVTHKHGDHFDPDVLRELAGQHNVVITPEHVAESVPACDPVVLANGESHTAGELMVTAVPAYNRTEERLAFHPRGRDNGYLLELDGVRVYISGDTEDVPELASVAPVDAAFLCMNLPWTMSVNQAARAVKAIRPRVLYPYHHRNRDGSSADLGRLRTLVGEVAEVRVLAWY